MQRLGTTYLAKLEVTGNSQNAVSDMGLGMQKSEKIFYTLIFL